MCCRNSVVVPWRLDGSAAFKWESLLKCLSCRDVCLEAVEVTVHVFACFRYSWVGPENSH